MLVGESPKSCATFLYNMAHLPISQRVSLVRVLSYTLSWDVEFMQTLLLELSALVCVSGLDHRAHILLIYESMSASPDESPKTDTWSLAPRKWNEIKGPEVSPVDGMPRMWKQLDPEDVMDRLMTVKASQTFLALFEVLLEDSDRLSSGHTRSS